MPLLIRCVKYWEIGQICVNTAFAIIFGFFLNYADEKFKKQKSDYEIWEIFTIIFFICLTGSFVNWIIFTPICCRVIYAYNEMVRKLSGIYSDEQNEEIEIVVNPDNEQPLLENDEFEEKQEILSRFLLKYSCLITVKLAFSIGGLVIQLLFFKTTLDNVNIWLYFVVLRGVECLLLGNLKKWQILNFKKWCQDVGIISTKD